MAGAVTLTHDQELWGCAFAVAREHGDGASLFVAMEIDRFDVEGERDAAGVWQEVLKRLEALEARSAQRQ